MADEYKLDIPDTRSIGERFQDAGGAILDAIASSGGNPRALAAGIIGGGLRAGIGTDSYLAGRQQMANAYAQSRLGQMSAEDTAVNYGEISKLNAQKRANAAAKLESEAKDIAFGENTRNERENAERNSIAARNAVAAARQETLKKAQQEHLTADYTKRYDESQSNLRKFVEQTPYFQMLTPKQKEQQFGSSAFREMAALEALFQTASDPASGIDAGTEEGRTLISNFARTMGADVDFSGKDPVLKYNGQDFKLNDPQIIQMVQQTALNAFKEEADNQIRINQMLTSPDPVQSTIGNVCHQYAGIPGLDGGRALGRVQSIMRNGLDGNGRTTAEQAYFMLNCMSRNLRESMKNGRQIDPQVYQQAEELLQMAGLRMERIGAMEEPGSWRFSRIGDPSSSLLTLEQVMQIVSNNDTISRDIAVDYKNLTDAAQAEQMKAAMRKGNGKDSKQNSEEDQSEQEKQTAFLLEDTYGDDFALADPKDQDAVMKVYQDGYEWGKRHGVIDKSGRLNTDNIENMREFDRTWNSRMKNALKDSEKIKDSEVFYSPVSNALLQYEYDKLYDEWSKASSKWDGRSNHVVLGIHGAYPQPATKEYATMTDCKEKMDIIEVKLKKRGLSLPDVTTAEQWSGKRIPYFRKYLEENQSQKPETK